MLERELKFHVPSRQRAALKAQLRKLKADTQALHARYYDTASQNLAKAGIALRLRREGEDWVQTMKLPGPDELSRIEWNHPRPEPTLDLSVYADTHVSDLLNQVSPRLACRYSTQVTRLKKVVATATGEVELAYDEGAIMAGGIQLPVHELEIEQLSGEASDLSTLPANGCPFMSCCWSCAARPPVATPWPLWPLTMATMGCTPWALPPLRKESGAGYRL